MSDSRLNLLGNTGPGRIKVRRLVSDKIDTKGYYRHNQYVGTGDCGFVPVCDIQELEAHIKNTWGGGNYELTHLDPNDRKISIGYLTLPDEPKLLQ